MGVTESRVRCGWKLPFSLYAQNMLGALASSIWEHNPWFNMLVKAYQQVLSIKILSLKRAISLKTHFGDRKYSQFKKILLGKVSWLQNFILEKPTPP